MNLSFRNFQIIGLVPLLSLIGLALWFGDLGWWLLVGGWAIAVLVLKTQVTELKHLPIGQRLFAVPNRADSGGKFNAFLHEAKRSEAASIGLRLAAYVIDMVIVLLCIIVISGIMMVIRYTPDIDDTTFIILALIGFMPVLLYLFLRDGTNGQSVGKRLVRIQVIKLSTGKPIGYGRSALRYVCLRLLGIIELIVLCVQPNHRRIGDWLCDTMVIKLA